MYPVAKDYQNAILIKLYDKKNEYPIRMFWTQEPEMFLKMYTFMQEHEIDIDIEHDVEYDDKYNDKIGTITDIIFLSGGKETFNTIKIYLDIRDYK